MPKKPAPTGRDAKDELMAQARQIASSEHAMGFMGVVRLMESRGVDTAPLRIWAGAKDRDEIDRMCAKFRTSQPKARR